MPVTLPWTFGSATFPSELFFRQLQDDLAALSNTQLTGSTFAGLPAGVAGTMAYVTDSPSTTLGGTITIGGSTNKVLVWNNGVSWTIIGH